LPAEDDIGCSRGLNRAVDATNLPLSVDNDATRSGVYPSMYCQLSESVLAVSLLRPTIPAKFFRTSDDVVRRLIEGMEHSLPKRDSSGEISFAIEETPMISPGTGILEGTKRLAAIG